MKGLIGLIVFCSGFFAQAKVNVEYRVSRIQGLVNFVFAITGEPHYSPGLIEIYEKSSYNTPEMNKIVSKLKSMQQSFHNSFHDSTGSKYRKGGQNVMDLFTIQSIYAKDLGDLSTRTLGLLPMADHLTYFTEIKKMEPIYNKLIWKNLGRKLFQHKARLEAVSKKAGLDEMFTKAEKFYNSQWPEETPFVIALYPVPYIEGFKNSTNSHSIGSVEVHGVMVEKDNQEVQIAGSFGVIFHELCHSLFDAQSSQFKLDFERYFLENPSAYSAQAYTWFNEAAATAVGNGWAYARANKGGLEDKEWYNDSTIDGYAKEIYPLIEVALEKGQSVDKDMVGKFVLAYEKRFPKSIFSFENLLHRLIVCHDGKVIPVDEIRSALRKNMSVHNLNFGAPIDHPETMHDVVEYDDDSVMFIFSNESRKQIEHAAETIPYIKENIKQIETMKDRSVYAGIGEHGRAYVFVKVQNQKDFQDAIVSIVKKELINPQVKIWNY